MIGIARADIKKGEYGIIDIHEFRDGELFNTCERATVHNRVMLVRSGALVRACEYPDGLEIISSTC